MAQGLSRVLALLSPLAAMGCQGMNTPIYFNGPTEPLLTASGGEEMPPTNGLTLRFRNPTQKEREALAEERDARGYDQDIPWVAANKVHIELSYLVTNTSDHDGVFTLMVNGASEFVKYDMNVAAAALALAADEETGPLFPLMTSDPQTVPAGGTFSGLIREDDFAEAQLDTDALGRWLDTDTFAGVLINRSEAHPENVRPIGMGKVPGFRTDYDIGKDPARLVVPAFVEINVSLIVEGQDTPMTAEYVVRVRDDDDRLLHLDGDLLYETSPTLFEPAIMMN